MVAVVVCCIIALWFAPGQPTKVSQSLLREGDPGWVASVPGSHGAAVKAGECGQFNGATFHRIECPR